MGAAIKLSMHDFIQMRQKWSMQWKSSNNIEINVYVMQLLSFALESYFVLSLEM